MLVTGYAVFLIYAWIILGFIAFVLSLVCFSRSGSILEKILGFFLAIFFGPFYFLFYLFDTGYCR